MTAKKTAPADPEPAPAPAPDPEPAPAPNRISIFDNSGSDLLFELEELENCNRIYEALARANEQVAPSALHAYRSRVIQRLTALIGVAELP